ncbi:glycosyltransferase family 2 protein [Pradoshia eiseniae]|uniref:Glycosyltransferase family 2 protein n=1 Tax=Pradoshia eiseniae TaxID=2064768 RepID=A0A2S7N2I8_9BACI|nr:glycosyltransferase family A protein [Pradoshia eiseniae]PQD96215.1 glycosyltransferase family 2 protein [Pradoshia eiseniae]
MKNNYRSTAQELLQDKQLNILNHPNSLKNKLFKKKKLVTVICASYNAEKTISKMIESVIDQTLGMENIELIIVDDCSTDKTTEIIQSYTNSYSNISLVKLKQNTGTPGIPRNIGIELATGRYISFIDADDWFHPNGLKTLSDILEETGDYYAVGKTIKVSTNGESIIGEWQSNKERRSVSPFDIPYFFYHLGPPARMVKSSLLYEHHIGFPEMKFAEDKLFFMDVLLNSPSVSTTKEIIYYANRLEENTQSLTRITSVLDKRFSDLKVIKHIKDKKLPVEQEKVLLNRIYEYDFLRTFDSMVFVNSKEKQKFFDLLGMAYETTKDLSYNFLENIEHPTYKLAMELYIEGQIEDFIKLFTWVKKDKYKKYVIQDNIAYFEVPFLTDERRFVEIAMFVRALDSYYSNNQFVQQVEVYSRNIEEINSILIRDRNRVDNEIECSLKFLPGSTSLAYFEVDVAAIEQLQNSAFTLFLKYADYKLANIKKINKTSINYKNKTLEFYITLANNLGLSIKTK